MVRITTFLAFFYIALCMSACNSYTKNTIKKDIHREFLYSKEVYTVDLNKEQLSHIPNGYNTIHTLVLNINSKDAEKITTKLEEKANELKNKVVKQPNGTITSFTGYSGMSHESNKYISIITKSSPYLYPSEGQAEEYKSYIFTRANGKLLLQDTFLSMLHLTKKDIIKRIKDVLLNQGANICDGGIDECFLDPEFDTKKELAMYINKENLFVVYVRKQHGLLGKWVPLVIPQIHVPT